MDRDGGLYFTDPNYPKNESGIGPEGVYYITAEGEVTRVEASMKRPNGIVLDADRSTLYVADNGAKQIIAYDVASPGALENKRVFAELGEGKGGPDGMTLDRRGRLYVAMHGRGVVRVFSTGGEPVGEVPIPEQPTNVTFGSDGRTLYITAGGSLYAAELNID